VRTVAIFAGSQQGAYLFLTTLGGRVDGLYTQTITWLDTAGCGEMPRHTVRGSDLLVSEQGENETPVAIKREKGKLPCTATATTPDCLFQVSSLEIISKTLIPSLRKENKFLAYPHSDHNPPLLRGLQSA